MTVCLTVNGTPSARRLGRRLHGEPGWTPEEYLWTLKRPLGNNNKGQQMKLKMSKQKKTLIWECSRQPSSSTHMTQALGEGAALHWPPP